MKVKSTAQGTCDDGESEGSESKTATILTRLPLDKGYQLVLYDDIPCLVWDYKDVVRI